MIHYEVWKSTKNGKWYWHLVSKNGRILADGGQGYHSKGNLTRSLEKIRGLRWSPVRSRTEVQVKRRGSRNND